MVEQTPEATPTTEQQPVEDQPTENLVRPEYPGDKGDYNMQYERNTPVEQKTVATFSFGQRVRIAALNTP
jgi:hypothetical protein